MLTLLTPFSPHSNTSGQPLWPQIPSACEVYPAPPGGWQYVLSPLSLPVALAHLTGHHQCQSPSRFRLCYSSLSFAPLATYGPFVLSPVPSWGCGGKGEKR